MESGVGAAEAGSACWAAEPAREGPWLLSERVRVLESGLTKDGVCGITLEVLCPKKEGAGGFQAGKNGKKS